MAKFLLSENDRTIIKQVIDWWRSFRPESKKGGTPHKFQSPDIYIALPPSDGIPGITEASGTGADDTPGSATCTIHKINSSGDFEIYTGLTKVVYNLSREAIPQNFNGVDQNWILVVRSKQGKWIAQPVRGYDRCNATLKGAITSSGTGSVTTTVDNVVATRGATPVSSPTDELTVDNFFQWDADDNAACKIEYNHDDDTWELYQVDCPV